MAIIVNRLILVSAESIFVGEDEPLGNPKPSILAYCTMFSHHQPHDDNGGGFQVRDNNSNMYRLLGSSDKKIRLQGETALCWWRRWAMRGLCAGAGVDTQQILSNVQCPMSMFPVSHFLFAIAISALREGVVRGLGFVVN